MTAGLLYKCRWSTARSWSSGWEMLLFIGIETIHREDGVDVHNYVFHDIVKNEQILLDESLTRYCEEIKGDSHECD